MLDETGLHFEQGVPARPTLSNRADVACFIGFVARSQKFRARLPESLSRWLRSRGLIDAPGAPRELGSDDEPTPRVIELLQLPVPIDSWSTFAELFDWQRRPPRPETADGFGVTYLGAAVRSFFAQGGRKCFVIRAGDPLPVTAPRATRLEKVRALLPELGENLAALAPDDPQLVGIAHLFGLEEVSMVCLPDLPWLFASEFSEPVEDPPLPALPEHFVECSEPTLVEPNTRPAALGAPRLDARAYVEWARAVNVAAHFLAAAGPAQSRKDVQLVLALPLPAAGSDADVDVLDALVKAGIFERLDVARHGLSSAYVQLTYPWIVWDGSAGLPEGLEPADGALAGVLARGTLLDGAFNNFADQRLRHVARLEPVLSLGQIARVLPRNQSSEEARASRHLSLRQRVSLFGPTVGGFALLADVTTSADEAWRPANVNRLLSVWVRALQRAGEEFVFEPSGELTWANLRHRLQFIGERLFNNGALRGRTPEEAFSIRCDRGSMSPADIGAGRLIAEVQFRPAIPVDGIVVALHLDEAQRISISSEQV